MLFLNCNKEFSDYILKNINDDTKQKFSMEDRMQLVAKATLDKRLNSRDLKLLNYIICYEYLGLTQEEIAEMLNMSRSNVNKSFEKLASFRYIEKSYRKDPEKRKRIFYKPVHPRFAGLLYYQADDIIRVLNMSNVLDSEYRYNYCSIEDYYSYRNSINFCEKNLRIIEDFYEDEDPQKRKIAYNLVESYSPKLKNKDEAVNLIKSYINDATKITADTNKMLRKVNSFVYRFKSTTLTKEEVREVLSDSTARLLLFFDRTNEKSFQNFKEKYLEDYIRFVYTFENLSQDFFKLYYENKTIEMNLTEILQLLAYNHRDTPHKRAKAIQDIQKEIEEFLDRYSSDTLEEELENVCEEIAKLTEKETTSDTKYNAREIALLLYILSKEHYMESYLGLTFQAFIQLYNPDLIDIFKNFKILKKEKWNKLIQQTKEEY